MTHHPRLSPVNGYVTDRKASSFSTNCERIVWLSSLRQVRKSKCQLARMKKHRLAESESSRNPDLYNDVALHTASDGINSCPLPNQNPGSSWNPTVAT